MVVQINVLKKNVEMVGSIFQTMLINVRNQPMNLFHVSHSRDTSFQQIYQKFIIFGLSFLQTELFSAANFLTIAIRAWNCADPHMIGKISFQYHSRFPKVQRIDEPYQNENMIFNFSNIGEMDEISSKRFPFPDCDHLAEKQI